MAKTWLNLYSNPEGEWRRGQSEVVEAQATTGDLGGATVKICETSRSGCVTLSPVGERLTSYGDAEVYLRIRFADGRSQFLSAPLATEIEVANVQSIELSTLIVVGNTAVERIFYRGAVNAHCVYEIVEGTTAPIVDQSNLVSSGNLVVNNLQSVGQTFTVSRTGRLVGIEVAALRCQATDVDTLAIEIRQSASSLGTASLAGSGIPGPGLCGVVPAPLDMTTNGPGYFDLSALNVYVVDGQSYNFKLTNAADRDFRVGISANLYVGGTATINDSASNFDLAFKIVMTS